METEIERKWDYFLKAMYQAIRYPDPSIWDDEDLMASREKMCWKVTLNEADMDWTEFRRLFEKEPYWKWIVERCRLTYSTDKP